MLAAGQGNGLKPASVAAACRTSSVHEAALERRQRIAALARPLERIAAGLDRAAEVAGLAGDAAQVFEAVVVGLELVVGDAPVLDRHVGGNEALAVALLDVAARTTKSFGQEAPGLAVPVHAGAADAGGRAGTSRDGASAAPSGPIELRKVSVSRAGRSKSAWRTA